MIAEKELERIERGVAVGRGPPSMAPFMRGTNERQNLAHRISVLVVTVATEWEALGK